MLECNTVIALAVTCAAVAQSVERRIGSAEVTGPIPVSSSLKSGNVDDTAFPLLFFLQDQISSNNTCAGISNTSAISNITSNENG